MLTFTVLPSSEEMYYFQSPIAMVSIHLTICSQHAKCFTEEIKQLHSGQYFSPLANAKCDIMMWAKGGEILCSNMNQFKDCKENVYSQTK